MSRLTGPDYEELARLNGLGIRRLALSGGGFRATLFHLGVIRYLCETDQLKQVKEVASVSGGSILAAHLVLNWDDYIDPVKFPRAAKRLIEFVRTDTRSRVFIRWLTWIVVPGVVLPLCCLLGACLLPLHWLMATSVAFVSLVAAVMISVMRWFGRIDLLADQYERLYDKADLASLATPDNASPRPLLYIVATTLTTGDLCCFHKDGFVWARRPPPGKTPDPPELIRYTKYSVARAVAASSAFPPAFAPVPLHAQDLGRDPGQGFPETMHLTDGGVYDNLGLAALRVFGDAGVEGDLLISDAEQPFGWGLHDNYSWLPTRVNRSTDILMNRVSVNEPVPPAYRVRRVRLQDRMKGQPPDDGIQERTEHVRTDLNSFSAAEIQVLVHRGYARARMVFGCPMDKAPNSRIVFSAGDIPYVEPKQLQEGDGPDLKPRWLPFSKAELEGQSAKHQLAESNKQPILKPFLLSPVVWGGWVMPPLLVVAFAAGWSWLAQPALPTGLVFTDYHPHAKFEQKEQPLVTEILFNVPKGTVPFAVKSRPLGEAVPRGHFDLARPVADSRCTFTSLPAGHKPHVILVRASKAGEPGFYRVLEVKEGRKRENGKEGERHLWFSLKDVLPDDRVVIFGAINIGAELPEAPQERRAAILKLMSLKVEHDKQGK